MGHAHYIGRVGALAVALGIGTAVASMPAVAWADEPGDTTSANTNVDGQQPSNSSPEPATPTGQNAPGPDKVPGSVDIVPTSDAKPESGSSTAKLDGGAVLSAEGEVRDGTQQPVKNEKTSQQAANKPPKKSNDSKRVPNSPQPLTAHAETAAVTKPLTADIQTVSKQQAPTNTLPSPADVTVTAPVALTATSLSAQSVSAPEPTPAPASLPTTVITGLLAGILSPLASSGPNAPVTSPAVWVLAAAARRQLGEDTEEAPEFQTLGATGDVSSSLMAASVAALVPDQDAVFQRPDPTTGAVTGTVVPPGDPTGANRTPTFTVTGAPAEGTFTINRRTGQFTYTPTAPQRVLAGLADNPDEVTTDVTVTVTYGTSRVPVVISVPVSPTEIAQRDELNTGSGATGVAVTDTRAYVTNYDEGTVTVIDTVKRTVVATVTVGDRPSTVAVKPDGTRAYVVNQGSGTVSVIDTATNTKLTDIQVGANPIGIAISPSGGTVYVVNSVDRTVSKISTSTNRVVGTVRGLGINGALITVSPNGSKIYVANVGDDGTDGSVSVFTSTGTTAKTITGVGGQPLSLTVTPDSKRLYVGNSDGTISVVETSGYTVVDQFTAAGMPMGLAVNKDGTMLTVALADGSVSLYDTANHDLLTNVPTGAAATEAPEQIALSPDGMELYVTDPGAGTMHVVSLVPLNHSPVVGTPQPGDPSAAGVIVGGLGVDDPDGDTLKYTVTTAPGKGKVVVNPDGTFTYTPSAAARHAASAVGAGDDLTKDTFVVTVSDGRRGVVTQQVTVDISPANADPAIRTTVGRPSSSTGVVTGSVTATDRDRDALTFTTSSAPTKGHVTVDSRGRFTYTPDADARHAASAVGATAEDKVDHFTVTVDDGHGGTVDVAVTVNIGPRNAVPNSTGSIGLPNNDTGVVHGAITTVDADTDALSYRTTTLTKGSIVFNGDGTFTYTPTEAARQAAAARPGTAAARSERFTVTIDDGHGGTDTVTLAASIAALGNNAPTNGSFTTNSPSASTGSVAGRVTATDADNDRLTYSGSTTTAKGKVTVNSNGTFTYTPTAAARHAASAAGADPGLKEDSFTVTVVDGFGGSTTVDVKVPVSPKNAVPAVRATASRPNATSGVVTVTVTATDTDKDTLSFSGPASTTKGNLVNNGDGTFTYTPTAAARAAAGAVGAPSSAKVDTLTMTVTDGHGGVGTANVSVSILPGPPVANNAPVNGDFSAGQPDSNGDVRGTATATDPDGDQVRFTGTQTTSKGSVTVLSNGDFTYTPNDPARHAASAIGASSTVTHDTFDITATDGRGGTLPISVTVDISPSNHAPVGSFQAGNPTGSDGLVQGVVTSTDLDNDTRTYSGPTASAKGGQVTVNSDGTFSYKPSAAARQAAAAPGATAADKLDSFTVTINDGHSPNGTSTVSVQVGVAPASSTSTDPAAIDGVPLGGPIVGSTGTVFQPIATLDDQGLPSSTFVRVYSSSGALIGTTSAFTGLRSAPVVRTDGGITLVSYDEASQTATVRVVDASGAMTSTPFASSAPPSLGAQNGRQYIVVGTVDAQNTVHLNVVPLTAGAVAGYAISSSPMFGPDGSIAALHVTGTTPQDLSVEIVVVDANGQSRTMTAPELLTSGLSNPSVGPNGVVYLPTAVSNGQDVDTEVLVFDASGGYTKRLFQGVAPASNVIVAPNGTAYLLTDVFGTSDHQYRVAVVNGSVSTPVISTAFFTPTMLGASDNGTLYVLDSDSDADVSRLIVVKPNAGVSSVPIGDFSFDVDHLIGADNNIYVRYRENAENVSAVVSSDGQKRVLPFQLDFDFSTGTVSNLVFGADGTAYALVPTSDGVEVRTSSDGFVTYRSSGPIDATGGSLHAEPNGAVSFIADDSSVTVIDRTGHVVGTVPATAGDTLVGLVVADNGTAYVALANGSVFDGSAVTTVWAVTPAGADVAFTQAGMPGSPGASALSVGRDGQLWLTTAVYSSSDGQLKTLVKVQPPVSSPSSAL